MMLPSFASRFVPLPLVRAMTLMVVVFASDVARAAQPATSAGEFAAALAKGPIYAGLAAFVSGLLVALTPCVYPMVAITVSVFGARETKSRTHGALLSGVFVLGIITMFVPLGVAAGLTGSVFGSVLSNQWVIVSLSTLFVLMAASMFGAFELDIPAGIKNRLARLGGGGMLGAFVLGLICGPIAAPCTGPFLTGILAWIAQTQSASMGAMAMGVFALGLGVPFFLVGAFAMQLPKSGAWMMHVKSVLGIILLIVALYFLATAFPVLNTFARPGAVFLLAALGTVAVGLLLGAVHRSFEDPEWPTRLAKGVGVLLVTAGGFQFVQGIATPESTLSWEKPVAEGDAHLVAAAQRRAVAEGKPMLLDFTAAWCVACKEISKLTFSDERVQREAGRFVALKVDATDDTDPKIEQTLAAFGVQGLPAVLLFDSSGQEVQRFTEFVDADRFLAALQHIN